jgi:hypothetical protein
MEKYICIHGHFYQPPRENPWLEDIEVQDSAYPFHDWNERYLPTPAVGVPVRLSEGMSKGAGRREGCAFSPAALRYQASPQRIHLTVKPGVC